MSTFTQIKANIRINLNDVNAANFSNIDLDDSVQDAYDEISFLTQCIIKKVTLNFQNNLNYYNFVDPTNFPNISVPDFMGTVAIFSNLTNMWLLDNRVLKDFDRDRLDWENWNGNAVWWAPCNDAKRIAIIPKMITGSSSFDLYYYAAAPTVVDGNNPVITPEFETLIEIYSTADLLESFEEFSKAKIYWDQFWGIDSQGNQGFDSGIFALAEKTKNIAKSDLLLYG